VTNGSETLHGRKLGDRRVRVARPEAEYFRYAGPDTVTAKRRALEPSGQLDRLTAGIRAALIGRPLASEQEIEERLSKRKALAIFSSDAISSSAYASEEILRVLVLAGPAAIALSVHVSLAIALMLAAVAISYRQVVFAYPGGGGSYAVAKANFGRLPSLVAASALLIDYVMTVAVSTSSAVEQITSAIPELIPERVLLGVTAIAIITLGNLRGLRESGNIFALPTYLFIGSALLMIGIGAFRVVVLGEGGPPPATLPHGVDALQPLTAMLLLRAFAGGAVALTGTEAIATGVRAFKPPEPRNAAATLLVMSVLLGTLFVGITWLSSSYGIVPIDEPSRQTIPAQVAQQVYGASSIGFFAFQAFTALVLFLAANTSFNAFPRLAAILGTDGFMPRQLSYRGDRLAFSRGILALGALAALLIVAFRGDTHAIIPLYAVGVFIDFSISQAGMIRHWLTTREDGWQRRLGINTVGLLMAATVGVVVIAAKAPLSLLVLVLIPAMVWVMMRIHGHYARVEQGLEVLTGPSFVFPTQRRRVIVPVPGITRPVQQALDVGRNLSDDVTAVHVTDDLEEARLLRERFEHQFPGIRLVVIESPYRQLVGPLVAYLDRMAPDETAMTYVIVPEYVVRHWWEEILHNHVARRLRRSLLGRPNTVVSGIAFREEQ
jgi:amino acid transporter